MDKADHDHNPKKKKKVPISPARMKLKNQELFLEGDISSFDIRAQIV